MKFKLKICFKTENVVSNVDMSSLRAPWQNGPYTKKHTEQFKTQNIQTQGRTIFLCFTDFFKYNFLNGFSEKCWVTALVRSMTFIGG